MIVTSLKDGWEVIYQRSHAGLAAMLLAGWAQAERPTRWTELLIATAQHDDQEMFWDDSTHLTELGKPLHFTEGELGTTLTQAQWVINNAYRQGVWIALMISMHNSHLYQGLRGENPQIVAFLERQAADQAAWRKLLKQSQKDAQAHYALLQWADSLSLILCCHRLPEFERAIDVAPHPNGEMIRVSQRADSTLKLEPWVLEGDRLTVSVEVRRLFQAQFNDEQEFRAALDAAEIEFREWTLRR